MGAWSEDIFGNDTACDWIDSFLEDPGLPALREALEAVLETEDEDYLDSDEACEALAACEVIARLQGRGGVRDADTEALDEWITGHPLKISKTLKTAANAAITRILAANSELPELWDEGGRNEKWHGLVEELRERVKG